MKVLVTGGAGFVGSHLVDELVRQGYLVRVLDNLDSQVHGRSQKKPKYLNKDCQFIVGDVRDGDVFKKAIRGVDAIYHLAAAVGVGQSMYQIKKYLEVNTLGTATLLDLLVNTKNKIKKLIIASSMSIYGEGAYRCKSCGLFFPQLRPDRQLRQKSWKMACPECGLKATAAPTPETKVLYPTSIYALSKRDQEEQCLIIGKSYKIPTTALRYFNIYGSRQSLSNPYTGVCAIFSSRIKNNHPPLIYEDGQQTRDFIHVQDIVQANLLALSDSRFDYQALNVGSGRPTSILEIARILIKLYRAGVKPKIVNRYRAGDIRHCFADISHIQRLGFLPLVSFEDGFRELIEWGKQQRAQDRTSRACLELKAKGLTR
jgi:dTDP-L-rhamnose 4-epimerase